MTCEKNVRRDRIRVWGGIIIIIAGIVFVLKVSMVGMSQMIAPMLSIALDESSVLAHPEENTEAQQLFAAHGGINDQNFDLWPGYLEDARESGRYSEEAIEALGADIARMQPVMAQFDAMAGVVQAQYACLVLLLGAAVFVLTGHFVSRAAFIAALAGVGLAVSLAFFWSGYLPLGLAAAVIAGAGMAYVGGRLEARAKARTAPEAETPPEQALAGGAPWQQ